MKKRLFWVAALLVVLGSLELAVYSRIKPPQKAPPRMTGTHIPEEMLKDQPAPMPLPPPATRPPDDQPRPGRERKPAELTTPTPTVEQLQAAVKGANVIIVVLDAMRADHVGCYGYPRDTTPNIDRLARESVVFEEHFCQFPHTTSSTASLFTSQYPDTNGMVFDSQDDLRYGTAVVDPAAFTMEKGLQGAGLATHLFTANLCASPALGVGSDFQEVKALRKSWRYQVGAIRGRRSRGGPGLAEVPMRPIGDLLPTVAARLKPMCASRFFAYVHFLPPHIPYQAPKAYVDLFRDQHAPGYWQGEAAFSQVWLRTSGSAATFTGDEWVNRYDANLRWGDDRLGKLLEMLEAAGALDKSLLIVTADHGEGLGEHRYEFHMTCPYDEAIHIPLLIRFPGGKGPVGRVTALTQTIDLLPTIMDLFQIPYPKDQVQGRSLLPLLTGESQRVNDYVFARTGGVYPCYVVRSKDWSLLLYRGGKLRALYDLWDDPRQRYNVIAKRPEAAAAAAQAFEAFAKAQRWPPLDFVDPKYQPPAGRERPTQEVSEETRRQLRALGYLK